MLWFVGWYLDVFILCCWFVWGFVWCGCDWWVWGLGGCLDVCFVVGCLLFVDLYECWFLILIGCWLRLIEWVCLVFSFWLLCWLCLFLLVWFGFDVIFGWSCTFDVGLFVVC